MVVPEVLHTAISVSCCFLLLALFCRRVMQHFNVGIILDMPCSCCFFCSCEKECGVVGKLKPRKHTVLPLLCRQWPGAQKVTWLGCLNCVNKMSSLLSGAHVLLFCVLEHCLPPFQHLIRNFSFSNRNFLWR